MIYRDDDLPQGISIELLDKIQGEFDKRNKIHTMCILARELQYSPEFVSYVNDHKNIDITFHGWDHVRYGLMSDKDIANDIVRSLDEFKKYFNKLPTVWYPPWNGWVNEFQEQYKDGFYAIPRLKKIAKNYGLKVDETGKHFNVLLNGDRPKVAYFHHWHKPDIDNLSKILEINV